MLFTSSAPTPTANVSSYILAPFFLATTLLLAASPPSLTSELPLSAVAARYDSRRDPLPAETGPACASSLWCAPGRVVEQFYHRPQSTPYLFAFAVDEIVYHDISPKTMVYAGLSLVDEAARVMRRSQKQVGKMKYLRPLYTALAKCSNEGMMLGRGISMLSRKLLP